MIVRIDRSDFGREMVMLVYDIDTPGTDALFYVPRQVDEGFGRVHAGMDIVRVKEGERTPENAYFMRINANVGERMLAALMVEMVRLGYAAPDPLGHRVTEMSAHLKTLEKTNDRNYELLAKFVDAVTPEIRSERK